MKFVLDKNIKLRLEHCGSYVAVQAARTDVPLQDQVWSNILLIMRDGSFQRPSLVNTHLGFMLDQKGRIIETPFS